MRQSHGREIAYIGLFAALTAVGAMFSFQLGSAVPFSLQVLFTLLSGAVLGSRMGSLSQASYVLMGLVGLPVFAMRRAGFGVLFGPTGGFLIGFILGAWVTGMIVEKLSRKEGSMARSAVVALVGMVVGALVIYVPGIAWLAWHVGGVRAALVSMVPFIPTDVLKAVIGAAVFVLLRARGIAFHPTVSPKSA